jgi:hypothetical protein
LSKTTKIDELTLAGRSGQRYEFRIYVWTTKFKAVAGVYVVAARTIEPGQKAKYEPLFVGAAKNLSAVLKDHPREECFQMYLANVIGVLKEDNEEARTTILADLLDGLAPACNAPDAP